MQNEASIFGILCVLCGVRVNLQRNIYTKYLHIKYIFTYIYFKFNSHLNNKYQFFIPSNSISPLSLFLSLFYYLKFTYHHFNIQKWCVVCRLIWLSLLLLYFILFYHLPLLKMYTVYRCTYKETFAVHEHSNTHTHTSIFIQYKQ